MKISVVNMVIPLLLAMVAPSKASAASPDSALILARLVSVEDVTPPIRSTTIDGTYRRTFKTEKLLVGEVIDQKITDIVSSARPVTGLDYYLLLDRANGQVQVAWSDVSVRGVCIDAGTADRYGIWPSIRNLQKHRPCKP